MTYVYEAYVEAEDYEEAEHKAIYDDVEWTDITDYDNPYDDIDVEEEDM